MKSILGDISRSFLTQSGIDSKLTSYLLMREHAGWKVHEEMLLLMRAMIAQEMLSKKFTKLDKEEKDIMQRSYYNASEIIKFLLNPAESAKSYVKMMRQTTQREQPDRKQP